MYMAYKVIELKNDIDKFWLRNSISQVGSQYNTGSLSLKPEMTSLCLMSVMANRWVAGGSLEVFSPLFYCMQGPSIPACMAIPENSHRNSYCCLDNIW